MEPVSERSHQRGQHARARWPSRRAFIIASVGSLVGLGNVWRFPFLSFKHGGGAFLIPYVVFLLLVALPLVQTELALGRLFQKGDIEAFGAITPRARGVGCISIMACVAIMIYYSAIIAWSLYYLGAACMWPFPWASTCAADDAACMADPARALPLEKSAAYFTDTVMQFSEDKVHSGTSTEIAGPVFGCLVITWLVCYLATHRSVHSIAAATRITVTAPWVILGVLIIYGATLEGAGDGVHAYIGAWDLSVLKQADAWSDAAGQVIFSVGAAVGIMSAYASFAPATTNIWMDNNYIAGLNSMTSFFAGFAVFSVLGNMAHQQRAIAGRSAELRVALCEANAFDVQCPADCGECGGELWMDLEHSVCCGNFETRNVAVDSFILAFSVRFVSFAFEIGGFLSLVGMAATLRRSWGRKWLQVYPAALQYQRRGWANILAILWFSLVFLVGIDSLFSHVEGLATVLTDTPRFRHLRKSTVAAIVCALALVGSIAFASDIGHVLIDSFDHYAINFGLFFIGLLEAYTVSWVWGWKETSRKCGRMSAAFLTAGYALAIIFGVTLTASLSLPTGINTLSGVVSALVIFTAAAVMSYATRSNPYQTLGEWIGVWGFAGTRNLRRTFQVDPKPWQVTLHILTFDVPIKFVAPAALLGLFVQQILVDARDYENGYKNYPNWLHGVVGGLVLGALVLSLLIFAVYPNFWDVMGVDENQGAQVAHFAGEAKDAEGMGATTKAMFEQAGQDGWGSYMPSITWVSNVVARRSQTPRAPS